MLGLEGVLAGERFVEHHSEREDLGRKTALLSVHLLGREIEQRAHQIPARFGAGSAGSDLGQSQVQDLCGSTVRDHDVVGRDVAVLDPHRVNGREPGGDLLHDHEHVANGGMRRENLVQRPALHELHDDVGNAVVVPEPVDMDDVRVVEAGEILSLVDEPAEIPFADRTGLEPLQGHRPLELELGALVDGAEPAFADEPVHTVGAVDDRADHGLAPLSGRWVIVIRE